MINETRKEGRGGVKLGMVKGGEEEGGLIECYRLVEGI